MELIRRFIKEKDSPIFLGQTPTEQLPSLPPHTTSTKRAPPVGSHPSDSSSTGSDQGFSENPDSSSAASTAPSLANGSLNGSLNEQLATRSISSEQDDHIFPCILDGVIVCSAEHIGFEDFHSHSLAHYGSAEPPNHAMCIFCNTVFDSVSPRECWRNRMRHIANHFENGRKMKDSRPDFKVLEDMVKKGYLSSERYQICALGTERPYVDGLQSAGWEPKEIVEKRHADERERNEFVVTDPRRELKRGIYKSTRSRTSRRVEVNNPADEPGQ